MTELNVDPESVIEELTAKKVRLQRKLRELRTVHEAQSAELTTERRVARQLESELKAKIRELDVIKRDWRPVPITHPWHHRDHPRHAVDG
jgi:hypothetical protein